MATDDENEIGKFFEFLLSGPPNRPQHPDFMKLSEVVLGHDGPTTDPNERFDMDATIAKTIDPESLTYMAMGRAKIFMAQIGLTDLRVLAALSSAWVDAFLVGTNWEQRNAD